ncbi:MAG TPA: aldo/keto reductase [Atribacteraceae bacterium]|nr:aldo/keto reductase [Atribacteraceae bacterium]
MQFRKLGWTDLNLSVIGFGAWAIGGGGWKFSWGPQDDAESIAAIKKAIELGVNWIDTAAVYGLGHSEEMIGQAIREMSEKPLIATKCALVWDSQGNIGNRIKAESVRRELEASLRRLRVEVIDLYQIHWPVPDEEIEEGWEAMAEFVKEGKVRYIGVSNFSVAQMKRIQAIHPIASLQPPYSMLKRDVEVEILPYCGAQKIGVVAYSPMQKGLLTGKMTRERVQGLAPDDHRRNDPMFQEPQISANLELVEKLRAMAGRYGKTVGELVIAWVLRRPEMTSAIVGARNPNQIAETVKAGEFNLSPEDVDTIEGFLK